MSRLLAALLIYPCSVGSKYKNGLSRPYVLFFGSRVNKYSVLCCTVTLVRSTLHSPEPWWAAPLCTEGARQTGAQTPRSGIFFCRLEMVRARQEPGRTAARPEEGTNGLRESLPTSTLKRRDLTSAKSTLLANQMGHELFSARVRKRLNRNVHDRPENVDMPAPCDSTGVAIGRNRRVRDLVRHWEVDGSRPTVVHLVGSAWCWRFSR
jgi:hypothetical protein